MIAVNFVINISAELKGRRFQVSDTLTFIRKQAKTNTCADWLKIVLIYNSMETQN